jgi:integrase
MPIRRRRPAEDGPRIFWRGRWAAADLRPWGGSRPTLRNARGERTENADTALRWALEEIAKLRQSTHASEWGVPERKTLEQAAEEYLDFCRSAKEYNTTKGIQTALNHMLAAFGGSRMVASITDEELQAWFVRHARFAPSTLQTLRAGMKAFLAYAGRPVQRRLIIRKEHQQDVDALTDAEIGRLLEACESQQEATLVRVGLATGCRPAELWALEWEDFKPDLRSVRVQRQMAWPALRTKGLKGKRNGTALVLPGFIEQAGAGRVLPLATRDKASYLFSELLKRGQ